MRKFLFLDIDGVLNHRPYPKSKDDINYIYPRHVENLNFILKEVKVDIVLSSNWRRNKPIEEMNNIFKKAGIIQGIYDYTPKLGFVDYPGYINSIAIPRGVEIEMWLRNNKDKFGCKRSELIYAILDDKDNFFKFQPLIKTHPNTGLDKDTANNVVRQLTKSKIISNYL